MNEELIGTGPLAGLRVIEVASIGPGPFGAMLLADLGANVLRIDRPTAANPAIPTDAPLMGRGRRSVALDLKTPPGRDLLLDLVDTADVLVEGFRPGVAERLGIGPDVALARNRRLVYGRVTGWGQTGPLAARAGHDINYIGLTGGLAAMGAPERPPEPPLNLVGDFGGGGMLLVVGVLAALYERSSSGRGQVVDAAMVDGASLLSTMFFELLASGYWSIRRGDNLLDGGAPFYATYETADGRFMSVGALEAQFYAELVSVHGLDVDLARQHDRATWPELRRLLTEAFKQRTRDEWTAIFASRDACVAPVLTLEEAREHDHNRARDAHVDVGGVWQPAPAPRFSRSSGTTPREASRPGEGAVEALRDWGVDEARLRSLVERGVLMRR